MRIKPVFIVPAAIVGLLVLSEIRHMVAESRFLDLADRACTNSAEEFARHIPPGLDPNRSETDEGMRLLQRSVECGNAGTAQWLLDHGADPNREGDQGPLMERSGSEKVRNLLRRAMREHPSGRPER